MYIYSSVIPGLYHRFHIKLPGTVPSLHYFFYFKALQSVFCGLGCVFLLRLVLTPVEQFINNKFPGTADRLFANGLYSFAILIWSIAYFPFYQKRFDFVDLREKSLVRQQDKDGLETYHYILQHIPTDKIILCDYQSASFPVMATARKMVAISPFFSNPYIDYDQREADRNSMHLFLETGYPTSAKALFKQYHVSYVLVTNKDVRNEAAYAALFGKEVFKNSRYTILMSAD
jgi:hypothetical protein